MDDRESLRQLYEAMYAAMIAKDKATLDRIHDDSFVLIHMTGMRQNKKAYIRAILDGTLNYYSERTERFEVKSDGSQAEMRGNSIVSAAVFGGGRSTWRLALRFRAKKTDAGWKLTRAEASTW